MPLKKGSSQEVIGANIAELVKAGHEQKQAEAIAEKMARGDSDADIERLNGSEDMGHLNGAKIGVHGMGPTRVIPDELAAALKVGMDSVYANIGGLRKRLDALTANDSTHRGEVEKLATKLRDKGMKVSVGDDKVTVDGKSMDWLSFAEWARPKMRNDATNSDEYEKASAKASTASRIFRKAQEDYRARRIGDKEFLDAQKLHNAAQKEFDVAFSKEQKRQEEEDLKAAKEKAEPDKRQGKLF